MLKTVVFQVFHGAARLASGLKDLGRKNKRKPVIESHKDAKLVQSRTPRENLRGHFATRLKRSKTPGVFGPRIEEYFGTRRNTS